MIPLLSLAFPDVAVAILLLHRRLENGSVASLPFLESREMPFDLSFQLL